MIKGYAATQAKQPLEFFEYQPKELGPWDIEVAITHCGICASDLHLINNDWGVSSYPFIPGHEIIGKVVQKGREVRHLKVGDRVGIGWQRSSCMACEWCEEGQENLCFKQEATCVGHHGGYADSIRSDSRFAFLIPEALESENAAPLLCGGATVFSPLFEHNLGPAHHIGVIGIGGLGHLAVQFARTLGAQVTAISSTADKEKEAKHLGAHHFILSKDSDQMKKAINTFDFILVTTYQPMDWIQVLDLLRPKGTLCFVGALLQPLALPVPYLIHSRKTVTGSNIASRPVLKKMLQVASEHGVRAMTELFSMQDVNRALDKLRRGDVRYRAVLKN